MKNKYLKDMEDVCDLAELLTNVECSILHIRIEYTAKNGDTRYTKKAQEIFERHYNHFCDNYNI